MGPWANKKECMKSLIAPIKHRGTAGTYTWLIPVYFGWIYFEFDYIPVRKRWRFDTFRQQRYLLKKTNSRGKDIYARRSNKGEERGSFCFHSQHIREFIIWRFKKRLITDYMIWLFKKCLIPNPGFKLCLPGSVVGFSHKIKRQH